MEQNENKLTVIPAERLRVALKNINQSTSVCPHCGKIVTATDYPYAYDPEENDIHYASICPECKNIMFSKD